MRYFWNTLLIVLCSHVLQSEEVVFKTEKDVAGGSVAGLSCVDVGLIDDDDLPDVFVAEGGKHAGGRKTFAWFRSPANTQDSWTRVNIQHGANLRSFLGAAKLADFDNDGDLDIAMSSDNHSGSTRAADVFVFLNPGGNGEGIWVHHKCNASTMALHHINDMEITDLDSDGRPDIVCRSLNPNQIHIFFQNSVSSWEHKVIDTGISQSEGLSVGLINGDSRPDITFTGYWLQTPSDERGGTYAKKPIDSNYKNTNQNTKEATGDIDGDGLTDIVIGPAESYRNGANHYLAWYKNPGSGYSANWQRHVIRSNTNKHHTVKLADMDNDGDLDVVTGKPWGGGGIAKEILVFYNDGNGGFNQVQQVVGGKGLYTGVVFDIGNDGDLDIVGQDSYANSSKPWLYESALSSTPPPPPADTQAPTQPGSLSASTIDENSIQLSWTASTDNIGVTDYEIRRDGTVIRTQSGTSYTDNGLNASAAYNYSVRARDAAGNWSSSATASAATDAPPPSVIRDAYMRIEAESFDSKQGIGIYSGGSGQKIGSIEDGTWAKYANVDFDSGATGFNASVSSKYNGGSIELRLGSTSGPLIGTCAVPGTGGWNTFVDVSSDVSNVSGVHDLYLVFSGGSGALLDVDYFVFNQDVEPEPNQAPSAAMTATPTSGTAPLQVSFNAAASSDSDGSIVSYTWNFGDGSNGSGVSPTHIYSSAGNFIAMVTVTDDDGATDSRSVAISVSEPPVSETRDAYTRIEAETYDEMQGLGIYNGGTGKKIGSIEDGRWAAYSSVDFGSGAAGFAARVASRTQGGVIELRLDAVDGPLVGTCNLPGTGGWENWTNVSCTVSNASGIHDLYLVFHGSGSYVGDVDYFVFDRNGEPEPNQVPVAALNATPLNGEAPLTVFLDATSSSDSDGSIVSYAWDFGDGSSGSGSSQHHTFTAAGNYTVTMTVTDNEGATDSTSVVISVSEPPLNAVRDAYVRIEAESYDDQQGLGIYNGGSGEKIGSIEDGRWARYAAVDFGDGASDFNARVSSKTIGGTIALRLNAVDGPLVGTCELPGTGSWENWVDVNCNVNGADGVHDLYLVFHGDGRYVGDVDYFVCTQDGEPEPNQAPTAVAAADRLSGTAPLTVNLDAASSTDSDGALIIYDWNFGDGSSDSGVTLSHSFVNAGNYTMRLTVTDDDGASSSDTLAISVSEPDVSDNSLLAHWKLNESSGSIASDESAQYNGTLHNGPSWNSNGWHEGALQFDGQNDYVDAGPINISGGAVTLAAWIRPERLDGYFGEARVLSQATGTNGDAHYFMLSPYPMNGGGIGVRFRLKINGTTQTLIASDGGISIGVWTHLAAVYDGSSMMVYQDGVEVGRQSNSGSITGSNSVPVWLGGNPSGATDRPFDGLLDDLRIYDRALNDSEIMDLAGLTAGNG